MTLRGKVSCPEHGEVMVDTEDRVVRCPTCQRVLYEATNFSIPHEGAPVVNVRGHTPGGHAIVTAIRTEEVYKLTAPHIAGDYPR